jgi:hypothetical protein
MFEFFVCACKRFVLVLQNTFTLKEKRMLAIGKLQRSEWKMLSEPKLLTYLEQRQIASQFLRGLRA